MLKFSNPYMFWYLFGLIPLAVLMIIILRWKKQRIRQHFNSSNLDTIIPFLSYSKWIIKQCLIMVAFVLLIFTLARPKFGSKVRMTRSVGIDLVIAVDVSTSMLCEDIKPNRIESTKDAVAAFLEKLNGDRVGLVAFAGEADVLVEMTNDYAAIKNMLSALHPSMFGTQGTSISKAIDIGLTAFPKDIKSAGAIILLTDGEDHEGELESTIKKAKDRGIHIFTVGIGTAAGGPIPLYDQNGRLKGNKYDNFDKEIITKSNPDLLSDIAVKGNGKYYSGEDPLTALMEINTELRKLERTEFENKNEEGLEERFQWVLIFVITLLIVELLYSEKRGKWLKKMDI